MEYLVEYTDTFGGESNYSWVKRETIHTNEKDTYRSIMRKAKKAIGITGLRGRSSHGEVLEFRPYRMCTVMFVIPNY